MHQLLHDAAAAFTYLGAAIMVALSLYVVFWLPFSDDRDRDSYD